VRIKSLLRAFRINYSSNDRIGDIERYLANEMGKNIEELRRPIGAGDIASGVIPAVYTRPSLIYDISSNSGTYSMSSTTPAAVTNLDVTITSTGRPIFVSCRGDGSTTSTFKMLDNSGTPALVSYMLIYIKRNGTVIDQYQINDEVTGHAGYIAPSSVSTFDDSAVAGSNNYTIEVAVSGTNATAFVTNIRLYAYEL
jgi:hypothetical protein